MTKDIESVTETKTLIIADVSFRRRRERYLGVLRNTWRSKDGRCEVANMWNSIDEWYATVDGDSLRTGKHKTRTFRTLEAAMRAAVKAANAAPVRKEE